MKKLAELWDVYGSPEENKVKCKVCSHYCLIANGKRGFCRTRENIDGKLYTLVYGSAIHRGSNDPIEKKPLYNFWPGSNAFSIATIGCNFHCKMCQNWEISQSCPTEEGDHADFTGADAKMGNTFGLTKITPEQVIKSTKAARSHSIAYTYNEPTIWYEFIRDTGILAHNEGINNILVSNGYSSPESNAEFVKFIDAANIDIKAFDDDFYKRIVGVPSLKPVLDTCIFFKKHGMHIEITNLIIPEENDKLSEIEQLCQWISSNLGNDTPLHFSAYHPDYRLNRPRTTSKILIDALKIAQNAGLHYVYVGNVLGTEGSNTLCPQCHTIIIEREGYHISNRNLTAENKCKKCGALVHIKGTFISQDRGLFF